MGKEAFDPPVAGTGGARAELFLYGGRCVMMTACGSAKTGYDIFPPFRRLHCKVVRYQRSMLLACVIYYKYNGCSRLFPLLCLGEKMVAVRSYCCCICTHVYIMLFSSVQVLKIVGFPTNQGRGASHALWCVG